MSLVPTTVISNALTVDSDALVAAAEGLRVVGWEVREGAGAAADFVIVNGATGNGGTQMIPVALAANETKHEWFWPGKDFSAGVSINMLAGEIDITIHTITTPKG